MNTIRKVMMYVGVGLFLYGASALVLSIIYPHIKTTIEWYKEVAEFIVGGGSLVVISLFIDKIGPMFSSLMQKTQSNPNKGTTTVEKKKVNVDVGVGDWSFLEESYDYLEFIASKLEDDEDKEMCHELQHKLLELHHVHSVGVVATGTVIKK